MADTQMSEIVVQAFREGNFTAIGESTTAEELTEAIPRLRNLINSVMGIELGEQLRDFYIPQTQDAGSPLRFPLTPTGTGEVSTEPWAYPPSNVRLVVKITDAKTLYFPAFPNDGARMAFIDAGSSAEVTLDGNGRKIEDAASVAGTGEALNGHVWLYRADMGQWIRIDETLEADDTVPLPPEFDDLWVAGLCIRLAPRFGVKLDESIAARYADMLDRLKKRYKQSERVPATSAELRQHFREF